MSNKSNRRELDGGCHCGELNYKFAYAADSAQLPARACSCSFCRKHGAVYTSHSRAELIITVNTSAALNRYRFGHETADFMICARCGVLLGAVCRIDSHDYAVLNINTINALDVAAFDHSITNFDGESASERLARRERNWIACVKLIC